MGGGGAQERPEIPLMKLFLQRVTVPDRSREPGWRVYDYAGGRPCLPWAALMELSRRISEKKKGAA